MYEIKQSTAETIPFFVHDANGDAVTGLTDGSFTKRISKGSAAFGAMTVTISEMENGWYSFPSSTSHSDTTGLLTVLFTNAGAKQVNLQWRVVARLPDDLAFPATSGRSMNVSAAGDVDADVQLWAATAVPTPTVTGVPEVDLTHLMGVILTEGGAGRLAAAFTKLFDVATPLLDVSAALQTVCSEVRLAELDAANLPADVDTLLTRVPDTISLVNIRGEAATALTDINLDHLLFVAATGVHVINDSVIAQMVAKAGVADWDTFDNATDSLEALRDRGDASWITAAAGPTAGAIADAVWDETLAGHTTAVTFGKAIADIETDAAAILVNVPDVISLANINAEVDTALATTTYAEPAQGAPGATVSLKDKIGFMYKAWRNRSNQTATDYQLFNDDATTVDHKATVSDDTTTAEKGEVVTGP